MIFLNCFFLSIGRKTKRLPLFNRFNAQMSQHCVRAQIVAYYYSLNLLLEDFPSIRHCHFVIGRARGGKDLDPAVDLCPKSRCKLYIEKFNHPECLFSYQWATVTCKFFTLDTTRTQIKTSCGTLLSSVVQKLTAETGGRGATTVVCRRKNSGQPVAHSALQPSSPHVPHFECRGKTSRV